MATFYVIGASLPNVTPQMASKNLLHESHPDLADLRSTLAVNEEGHFCALDVSL